MEEPKLKDYAKNGRVTINYSKLRDSIHKCEVEMADKKSRDECKRIFKDLNIDIVEE